MGDYQGNPLSCATACKTLEIMKRDNIPGEDQIDQAVEIFDRVIGRAENKFRIK